jgi:hypothetical protein
MKLNYKKEVIPHLIGIAIFYLIVLFYFSPAVFDGKILFQYDIIQWEGGAKEILDYRKETGEQALWTGRMFGGMPAYLVSMEIPGDITNFLTKIITLGLPHPVNSLFFGMVAMYILLLSFKVRPEFSIAGAIAFAFNTFHVISLDAGHSAKIWAICLIPLILAGIHLTLHGKRILGIALFAFGMMLQLKFNHLQITYYTAIIVIIYGIGHLISAYKEKTLVNFSKGVAFLLVGLTLALGANLSRFLTVLEYSTYSTRGASNIPAEGNSQQGLDKAYAFNWSQGKLETLTLLIPYLYGGASAEALPKGSNSEEVLTKNGVEYAQIQGFVNRATTYWGDQPGTGGPIYGGALMLFLFVMGLFYAPKNYRLIFFAITLLSIMLAWGSNLQWFNYTMFDILPGYNKFRAVTMALCMALFAIPVLGSLGLEYFFRNPAPNPFHKNILIALGSTGGVALLFVLFADMLGFRGAVDSNLPDWLIDAIRDDRKAMLRSSGIKAVVFIVLSFGLIWAAVKNHISSKLVGLGLAVLLIADLWSINKRYLDTDAFQENPSQQFFAKTPADQAVLRDPGYFRVLNLKDPFNEARTSYYFNSLGGYHGAKMKRYQELIEQVLYPEMQSFIQNAQEGNFTWDDLNAINMLNTKYLIAGTAENAVFENPAANGHGWFPTSIIQVNDNVEEINQLNSLDTKISATVNFAEFGEINSGAGNVALVTKKMDQLTYSVAAEKAGLVVFSEVFYPEGWVAKINGVEAPIIRTNYLLRGIQVPAGESEVIMEFKPRSYYSSKTIVVIFQYLIAAFLVFSLVLPAIKKT